MELRVLRYFLAVAREESISGAAEALHLSQPTLSRQLIDLENELGKQLFLRGSRKVTLTEDGVLLRRRASEIIDLVEKTAAEFREADEVIAGDIYIGGGESEGLRILGKAAHALQKLCPHIRYHLYSGNLEDLNERLENGLLDFMVMPAPGDMKQYDYIRLPYCDRWGALMHKDDPLAAKACIRPADLIDAPLLLSRNHQFGKDGLSSWFGCDYDNLHIVGTYNLVYNASLLVAEGVGYAITFDRLANTSPESDLCFRPLEPPLSIDLYLVWKKHQVFSKAIEKFLAQIRTTIAAVSESE